MKSKKTFSLSIYRLCVKMAFVYNTLNKINCFPYRRDFLHSKRSDIRIAPDGGKNLLNHDLVYLKGNEGSYYWVDSKGLRICFCDIGTATDVSSEDICSILNSMLSTISSFDEGSILSFSEKILSKVEDVFDTEANPDNSIDVFLGWKSIALLILPLEHPAKNFIRVRIGSNDYKVFC